HPEETAPQRTRSRLLLPALGLLVLVNLGVYAWIYSSQSQLPGWLGQWLGRDNAAETNPSTTPRDDDSELTMQRVKGPKQN
ncbi:MAG: hypothetical protein ACOY7J_16685, partial [Pseudomonadota bacterium]